MGAGAGRALRAVSVWEIAADPALPGSLLLRDEQGAARFASTDGGRTWVRSPPVIAGPGERRDAPTHQNEWEPPQRCA